MNTSDKRNFLKLLSSTFLVGASAAAMTTAVFAAGGGDGPIKVTYIYNYSAIDGGWNEGFYNSQEALKAEFGDDVEITYKENVPEGPQSLRVIESAIQDGANVLVNSSFGYGATFDTLAEKYPDVAFLAAQWASKQPNVVGFDNAPEDGAYIAGIAAGYIVDQGATIGWVDAFPAPYDLRTLNGFALGVMRSNPTATVQVVFTNNWSDSNAYSQAARSLINSGAQFLATSIGNPSIPEVGESLGVPTFATGPNMGAVAPTHLVTSNQYVWAPSLIKAVHAIQNNELENDYIYSRLADGGIVLSPWGGAYDELSDEAKADVQAEYERVKGGGDVFVGPLEDKEGNLVLEDGVAMTKEQLVSVNFVLPNVVGGGF